MIHRYHPVLSEKGTSWILPHTLRYCLAEEVKENTRMVTESLIFSLSPSPEFQPDTLRRFALLNASQIICLAHFLEWCLKDEYWNWDEIFSERICRGIEFLMQVARSGSDF